MWHRSQPLLTEPEGFGTRHNQLQSCKDHKNGDHPMEPKSQLDPAENAVLVFK